MQMQLSARRLSLLADEETTGDGAKASEACAGLSPFSALGFLCRWLWAALLLQEPAAGLTGILSLGFSNWSRVPGAVLGNEANSGVSGTLPFSLSLPDLSRRMASYAKQVGAIQMSE